MVIDPSKPDYKNTPVSSKRPRFNYALSNPNLKPWVTIITPFYNLGSIFHETAQSVLQQSLQQWEWLIVNDGSSEAESISILNEYREHDPRIKVIDHKINKGPSAARNTGFKLAQTSYVLPLDGDDLLEPTAAEKWFWFLESYSEYAFVNGYSLGFEAQEYTWEKGFHAGEVVLNENVLTYVSLYRKNVHHEVGGYDETIRGGLEDWEFWLRCANAGYWGNTVPEYLFWYRRRPIQNDRWTNWDGGPRQKAFHKMLRQRYPRLWQGHFPQIQKKWHMPLEEISNELTCENYLAKKKPRLLMIVPWLTVGGADKFNLDLLEQLTKRGWEVTIATTLESNDPWLPEFARYTPDIFILHHFLRLTDYPRFLQYLIKSRKPDVVLISNSEMGYLLLPYLRSFCPEPAYIDFCHSEKEDWKKGGYPRLSVGYQEQLDLTVVTSNHLKNWLVQRGGDAERIKVCYINVDANHWAPDIDVRARIRKELGGHEITPIILYAGRLCIEKQPKIFAQVINELKKQQLDFLALVAGDGEDRPWLEHYLRRHFLSQKVRILGSVSPERMRELMLASDIFFLPSKWEGIALTIYEAMASGLAVVGADVGGQRELVTEGCGFLLPAGDEKTEVQQYTEVLSRLLKEPAGRKEMGQRARSRICEHFRLEFMGDRMLALFEKARSLSKAQPRPAVSPGLGLTCATQAIEYIRLHNVADWLWFEQKKKTGGDPPIPVMPFKIRVYTQLTRIAGPFYLKGKQRGWRWVVPLKNFIKKRFLEA